MTTNTTTRVTLDNGRITLINGDCLEILPKIKPGVIDMVFADLPYGTTQNSWDSVLPLPQVWQLFYSCGKLATPYVMTAATPFNCVLGSSNLQDLKYDWIWRKQRGTGHLNAKKQPMRNHEHILTFYRSQCLYIPQMREGKKYTRRSGKSSNNYGSQVIVETENDGRYPLTVLDFDIVPMSETIHPTQKPVELLEYLIKTYTNNNDVVLDPTAGSGTTAVAAIKTGRRCIAIEKDTELGYFNAMVKRCEQTIAERDQNAAT